MNYAINVLKDLAFSLEREALKWEYRSVIVKGSIGAVLKEQAMEVSEEKWEKVHELWRAIHILEKNK